LTEKKISLGTVMFLIIIFVLIVLLSCLGSYTYNLKKSIEANTNNNLENLSASNSASTENGTSNEKNEQTGYKALTFSSLSEKDVLFVTNATKNNDGTYTLTGVIYQHDNENYNESEISDRWIMTNEYRTITVSKDLSCNMGYDYEDKYHTVEDVFSNYENAEPTNTSNPHYKHSFTFVFEDDECVMVKNVITGI